MPVDESRVEEVGVLEVGVEDALFGGLGEVFDVDAGRRVRIGL